MSFCHNVPYFLKTLGTRVIIKLEDKILRKIVNQSL
jgi:hypothetical protein